MTEHALAMRLLIVEDEKKLSDSLRLAFEERGCQVNCAYEGITGMRLAVAGDYDVLLLDVMLPAIGGLAILKAARQAHSTPILMFSAKGRVDEVVTGLQAGADDYLAKPFGVPELIARVQGLHRRSRQMTPQVLRIGALEMDAARHSVRRCGERLDLTSQELKLLALMLRSQGEVLSRTAIAEQLWDMNFNCDSNVVDVAVRRLRRKIEQGTSERVIHTVRGMGYVMELRSSQRARLDLLDEQR